MPRSLFSELKRRNVWRAAALYAAAAWLLVQVATQVFPLFHVPEAFLRGIVVAAILGFPFWIAFAWLYELTPEGLKRESDVDPGESIAPRTGKRLDRWIIGILAAAVVLLLANTFVWHKGGVLGGRDAGSAAPDAASGSRAGTGPGATPAGGAATAAPTAPPHSIAVLPFENLSTDKEQEFFADGISEDLLSLLAKVPALRVAARTSSFSFKGQHLEVREIARRLNVANVLEGSVRRAGEEVRITARLVHAADGYEVWPQTWDRKLDDVFQVQDEIASDVVKQLRVTLLGAAAPQARETDPRAYALYLQARELGRRFTREALLRSDSLYRQALAIDPRYAPAWTGLATNILNETGIIGVLPNEEGLRRARELAAKAVAIDSGYAPAYAVLGHLGSVEGDLARAAREYERALALDSTDPRGLGDSAVLLGSLGRVKEAIAVLEYVVERDPVNVRDLYNLGVHYLLAGRYDDAIARLRTALSLSPGQESAHCQIGVALLLKGDPAAALAEIEREPSEAWRRVGLPMAYHALGRKAESDAALAELIRKDAKDWAYNIAYVYAYRGEADRAFEWLEKAVEYDDPGLSGIVTEPLFANLRTDPRWLPFLRRIGKAPEQLGKIEFRVRLPEQPPPAGAPAAAAATRPAALADRT